MLEIFFGVNSLSTINSKTINYNYLITIKFFGKKKNRKLYVYDKHKLTVWQYWISNYMESCMYIQVNLHDSIHSIISLNRSIPNTHIRVNIKLSHTLFTRRVYRKHTFTSMRLSFTSWCIDANRRPLVH